MESQDIEVTSMEEGQQECAFCYEMFTSDINSCPQNIADHKMCPKCIIDAKKFFRNAPGCYYCGDRAPVVIVEPLQNTNQIGNRRSQPIFENSRINRRNFCSELREAVIQTIAVAMMLTVYGLMSYAWSFYVYLWKNYVMGENAEYETEDHVLGFILAAISGVMVTGSILACLFGCCLCCCHNKIRVYSS
tara:strand:+ start:395 stop:964 length:570 start_codon:yes stop_codon:yes gene_type:complete